MTTATLIKANLSRFCPVTHLYACSDGTHLVVTVKDAAGILAMLESRTGAQISVDTDQVPVGTEVYLADERGRILDANGDLADGMTPLQTFPAGTTHEDALLQAGFEVTG